MQYGIRMSVEDISYGEYKRLFGGLTGDTPIGKVISIRTEKDFKKIKDFSKEEKKIYNDWKKFRNKKILNSMSVEQKKKQVEAFQKQMRAAFYKGGKKGM